MKYLYNILPSDIREIQKQLFNWLPKPQNNIIINNWFTKKHCTILSKIGLQD